MPGSFVAVAMIMSRRATLQNGLLKIGWYPCQAAPRAQRYSTAVQVKYLVLYLSVEPVTLYPAPETGLAFSRGGTAVSIETRLALYSLQAEKSASTER